MSFASLALHEKLQQALGAAGYTAPTPVQAEAIPAVLNGKDLIVTAQTGTGKTAAFMLPALSRLATTPRKEGRGPRVLVLTPTRELAQQVTTAAQKYGSQIKGLNTISILGGMPFPTQNRMLSRPYDIMVATPGRLIDHMERGRISFERLEMLILDEADRMLDMGFIDDVELIASKTPAERQTLLFSATFEDRIAALANRLQRTPSRIEIAAHTDKHENISQRVYYADDIDHKKKLLQELLTSTEINQAIVFAGTRADSDALADELSEMGHAVDALHGDMKQAARNRTLNSLRQGRTRVLVATDVAARGIDVPGITHVINYDLPKSAEDYVHRIGRTGRAGRSGQALSLVGPRDRSVLRRIEQFTSQHIEVAVVEGLEPQRRTEARPPRRNQGDSKPRWGAKERQQRRDSFVPRRESGNDAGFGGAARPEFGNRREHDGARSENRGGFRTESRGGFRNENSGGFRSENGGGFRGDNGGFRGGNHAGAGNRQDRGGFGGGGNRGFSRDRMQTLEDHQNAQHEVSVSYSRPRRPRVEGQQQHAPRAIVSTRRSASDSYFDERS